MRDAPKRKEPRQDCEAAEARKWPLSRVCVGFNRLINVLVIVVVDAILFSGNK